LASEFQKKAARWDRFWRGEHPQPLIAAILPKEGRDPVPKPSTYALGPDLDPVAFADDCARWVDAYDFYGAAIPFVYLEFAADQFSTFLGVDLKFPSPGEGGWPVHIYDSCPLSDVHVEFRPPGKWWDLIAGLAETIKQRVGDRIMIASPTLVANLDSLVALRGAETVLMDLIDSPDEVKRVLGEITDAHAQILAALSDLLEYPRRGSINRHGMYSTGPINVAQCDFSCMISPAMFDEFVLPCLATEMGRYGGGEYHLDGADAIRHLDSLCSLDDLHLIQWVAGAGDTRGDWSELYRRIDSLGKGQIRGGTRAQLDQWAGELTAGRLFWNGLRGADRAAVEQALSDYDC
jgi:5-methyltetrahydrofolate--homocysteine methyltransferase